MLDDERGIEDIINLNAYGDSSGEETKNDKEREDTAYHEDNTSEKEAVAADASDDDLYNDQEGTIQEEAIEPADTEEDQPETAAEEETSDDTGEDDEPYYYDEESYDEEDGKRSRLPLILGILIPLAVIAALVLWVVLSDNDIARNYRENFMDNVSYIARNMGIGTTVGHEDGEAETDQKKPQNMTDIYNERVKTAVTIPFENALLYGSFAQYQRGAACAGENYMCYVKHDGKEQWRINTTVTNPIIRAEGDYIAVAEKNGKNLCLYKDKKLLYDLYTDENILSLGMNDRGDVVAVTEKTSYKGAVSVYNKQGNNIFAWASGSGVITSADISSGSRRVAAAVVNTDGRVYTTVSLFNIKEEESYSQIVCDNTLVFDMAYSQKHLDVFGDNSMIGISEDGDVEYDKRFDNTQLQHNAVDKNGNKLMVFEHNNSPAINVYSRNGGLHYTMGAKIMPEHVDIKDYNVVYNQNRDIILGKPDSKKPYKYTAAMDVKDVILIDSKSVLIIYTNSIEAVKFK